MTLSLFWQRHRHGLLLVAILALALLVRCHRLMEEGLWTDEMISLYGSNPEQSLRRTYDVLHFWDQSPPFYPVLLWLWLKLTGFTDLHARLLSVVGGLLSLVALERLVADLLSRRTALLVTLIVALTPYHIYFSREARSYIWALLLATLFLHAALRRLLGDHSLRCRLGLIASGALFLYASYFSFFLLASVSLLAALLSLRHSRLSDLRPWILDFSAIGLLFIPWLIPFLRILGYHNGATSSPSPDYLLQVLSVFSASASAGFLLVVAYVALLAIGLWAGVRSRFSDLRSHVCLAALFLFGSSYGLMLVKSLTGRNILNGFAFSYIIVLFPLYVVVLATFLDRLRFRFAALFALVFLAAIPLSGQAWSHSALLKRQAEPYRETAALVARAIADDQRILVATPYIQEFYFSRHGLSDRLIDPRQLEQSAARSAPERLWIVDSYDLKADEMLASVRDRFAVQILSQQAVAAPHSDWTFKTYLVQLSGPRI